MRTRLLAQPEASGPRKTLKTPEPYVFEPGGVYVYPTRSGEPINPYLPAKYFDRTAWQPDGFGLMLVVGRGRAFGYLAWYCAVKAAEIAPAVPGREALFGTIRWEAPFYGTCSSTHFRKMELSEAGAFLLDPGRVDHFFPHLGMGTSSAISDISIANGMKIGGGKPNRRWRRPDGKLEIIVYPPAPNLIELGAGDSRT